MVVLLMHCVVIKKDPNDAIYNKIIIIIATIELV